MPTAIDDLLGFWLGVPDPPGAAPPQVSARWWKKDDAFDAELRQRFGALHAQAVAGELDTWAASPRGRVALVILLDQLSRNLYRGDARAFAQDARAAALTIAALDAREHEALVPLHAYFLFMPLMHAEDLALQERCVTCFEQGATRVTDSGLSALFTSGADFARRHRDIVARFGRFPHRNAVLGRASSAEELEFLKQPGSSF